MADFNINEINEPLDLVKKCLGKEVYVKCRFKRELKGKLHAYDIHLNLLLSDVEETYDKENKRNLGLIFLRGDLVVYLAPI
ncbi:MAG: hypothetical protein MJ252_17280 [archaeon]|nr:hypothetical protein [archaeon]